MFFEEWEFLGDCFTLKVRLSSSCWSKRGVSVWLVRFDETKNWLLFHVSTTYLLAARVVFMYLGGAREYILGSKG